MNHNKYLSGFTILELLVVMLIIAFLASASVAILGNFNKKQSIKIAHDDVKNALAQAKSYALSQVKSTNCNVVIDEEDIDAGIVTPDRLIGYEVQFDVTTDPEKHSYAIYEICYDEVNDREKTEDSSGQPLEPVSKYYLPKDILFDEAPAPIRFEVLQGGDVSGHQTITIKSVDESQTTMIIVTPRGVIKDVEP